MGLFLGRTRGALLECQACRLACSYGGEGEMGSDLLHFNFGYCMPDVLGKLITLNIATFCYHGVQRVKWEQLY